MLPTPLRDHVWHAGMRNDRVLLLVESPAWATRVRMDQTGILAAVRSLGLAASSVTAIVAPLPMPKADTTTTRTLSPTAANTIRAAATAIADPELRALFLELADTTADPTAS